MRPRIALTPPTSPACVAACIDPFHNDPMETSPTGTGKPLFTKRFHPYPKFPAPDPAHKHPHAILAQNRGLSADSRNACLSPSEAMNIFTRGITALPDDILQTAIFAKYALAERSRHRLLLATWDLEGTKRQVRALEKIMDHLEKAHTLDESELRLWLQMYADRGLPDLTDDALLYAGELPPAAEAADRDVTELAVMVDEVQTRGYNIETLDDDGSSDDSSGLEFGNGDSIWGKGGGTAGPSMKHRAL